MIHTIQALVAGALIIALGYKLAAWFLPQRWQSCQRIHDLQLVRLYCFF